MRLVVEKIIGQNGIFSHYYLRVEDTNTDEIFLVEVTSQVWEDYNEGDEWKQTL
jgi:hypothetical protein